MRYLMLVVLMAGCGGALPTDVAPYDWIGAPVPDPYNCRLEGDACHCEIPEHDADAIARSGERCNHLRSLVTL